MIKSAIVLALFCVLPVASWAADAAKQPSIESITGEKAGEKIKTVTVTKGLAAREVGPGGELQFGERIKTGADAVVVVLYPDGSKVTVSKNSEFQVEEKVDGTQWNKLHSGQVRGVVTKGKDESSPSERPRFLIRSKSAVMGVRGTDFVMALEKGGSVAKFHTLEGSVEVARDTSSLLSGKGTAVAGGQFVEATPGGVSAPKSFDTEKFLKNLNSGGGSGSAAGAEGAASAASTPSTGGVSPWDTSAPKAPTTSASGSAPSIPPPLPRLADRQQQAQELKLEEARKEDEGRRIQLLAFQVSELYAKAGANRYRALAIAWTPIIPLPIPFIPIFSIRGDIGGSFFRQGVLNSNFVIHEFQGYASATLFNALLLEAGGGYQFWRNFGVAAPIVSADVGYVIKKNGLFNRIFVGRALYLTTPRVDEFKAGIGFIF